MSLSDLSAANRLLSFSVNRDTRPASDPEFRRLLDRYQTDPPYAQGVREAAEALGLRVLGADDELGLILDTASDSPFAIRSDELAREFRWESAEDRVIYGVAVVAVAAYCYPYDNNFSVPGVRQVTAAAVDELVRSAAKEGRSADGDETDDDIPLADALQIYVGEKRVAYGKEGSLRRDCTMYKVGRVLRWLADRGFMVRDATDKDRFRATEKFRVHVREVAGVAAYEVLSRVGEDEELV